MRPSLKIASAIVVNLSLLANVGFAELAEIIFEAPLYPPNHVIASSSPDGWQSATGAASITPAGYGYGGTGQALKVLADPAESKWVRKTVSWNAADPIAFIDFRIKAAASPQGSLANFFANGSQIAFQIPDHETKGEIWVLDGNDPSPVNPPPAQEQWFLTPGSFTVSQGSSVSSEWLRLTLRHDYTADLWDLYINDKLAAVNLAFKGQNGVLQGIEFYGSTNGDTLVDNLSAKTTNMLFPDADKDGMPDAWEIANGSNPNVNDRSDIKPGTGQSFLDLYLDSLWGVPQSSGTAVNGGTGGSFATGNIGTVPPLTILSDHEYVGALKGSLTVGGDGGANYSVPIDVPKGTAGMEPKISLNYSSNGGNGIAGLGWSLSGLQQITRGGSSYQKDGFVNGVDFRADDRFFLDGERLICVKGQYYGEPGSIYRTETDSFARITAVGTAVTPLSDYPNHVPGPLYWKVETKSGLTVYLGQDSDPQARINTSKGALSWYVTRVEDSVGNYYTVDYTRQTGSVTDEIRNQRVASIKYTGTSSTPAYAEIAFDYELRPDKRVFYTEGIRNSFDERLKSIRVLTGSHENHRYNLAYVTSQQTGRSLMTSVTKVGEGGALPPTVFQWKTLSHNDSKWAPAQGINIEEYGNDLDSRDGLVGMMSPVAGDPTQVHLTGVAWRAIPLDRSSTNANTKITFDYRAGPLPTLAMIGLDDDLETGSPPRLYKLVGGSNPPGGVVDNDLYTLGSTGDWQTKTIHIGADYSLASKPYLILVNDDVNLADGQGESWFRNIRIYDQVSPGNPDPATITPIQFDLENTVPQMVNNQGSDLGLRIQDFTGDGRGDLMYRIFRNKEGAGGGVVNLDIYGQTLINTATGYQAAPITTYQNLVTGIKGNATDAPWARRADIPSTPIDIDGDGKLDFCYAKNVYYTGTSSFGHEHGFMHWTPTGWIDRPTLALPFKSQCNVNYHRFNHFQFSDLNGDGYQDLLVHLNTGALLDSSSGTVISNAGSAWINRVGTGQPWLRNDQLALPKPLKIVGVNNGELGRRIFDINADGLPDFIESSSVQPSEVWINSGAGFTQLTGPDLTKFALPVHLTNGNGDDIGARLVDLNGDGLTDAIKDLGYNGTSYSTAVHLNTGDGWQQVANGSAPGADSWNLPHLSFTNFDKYEEDHPGQSSMADVNGDGLIDIVVARWDEHKRIYFNTGTDWWASDSGSFWADGGTVDATKYHMPGPIYRSPTGASTGKAVATFADVNGDGVSDYICNMDQPVPEVWINQCGPERIEAVTDGFQKRLDIEYRHLNDPVPLTGSTKAAYTPGPESLPAGQVPLIHGGLVVTCIKESDGVGGFRATRRHYGDLRYDRRNETSLGFGWTEIHDEHFLQDGRYVNRGYTRTESRRDYPFAGSPSLVQSYVHVTAPLPYQPSVIPGTKLVSEETSQYDVLPTSDLEVNIGGTVKRPVQVSSTVRKRDLNTTLMSEATTTQAVADFDRHGFLKKSTVVALDGSTTVTDSVYIDVPVTASKWHLGRLTSSAVTRTGPHHPVPVKSSSFTYDADTGLLKSERIQPSSDPLSVLTEYQHDDFGNVVRKDVTTSGQTRWATTEFGDFGRFPKKESSALGSTENFYDFNRALLTSSKDIDGRVTTFTYDAFGTKLTTDHPTGVRVAEITRNASLAALPGAVQSWLTGTNLLYSTAPSVPQEGGQESLPPATVRWARVSQSSGAPATTLYFDVLGREVLRETTVFTGPGSTFAKQYAVTRFDHHGRKRLTTLPFRENETPYWTKITYDILDRSMSTHHPDGAVEGFAELGTAYIPPVGTDTAAQGNDQTDFPVSYAKVYNKRGKILYRWQDQHGRLRRSSDPSAQVSDFSYDLEGRPHKVFIDALEQLENRYDSVGNKIWVKDLSSGTSEALYNGFGEQTWSKNARGEQTYTSFDDLGRITAIQRPEGTFTTSYRGASPNKGKAYRIDGPSGYLEQIFYGESGHDYGLPVGTSIRQTGAQQTYHTTTTYNALAVPLAEIDAGGAQIIHDYDVQYPVFKRMTRLAGDRVAKLSEIHTTFRDGSIVRTTEHLAHDVVRVTESEASTGRLKKILATRSGSTLQHLVYLWDYNGNLLKREDVLNPKVETFTYDDLDRLTSSTVGSTTTPYHYDPKGNLTGKGATGTHAYSNYRVSTASVKGETRSYSYDVAGHVQNDGKRTFTWASTGQLKEINQQSTPALDTFAATGALPSAIPGVSPWAVYEQSQARATFEFGSDGTRAEQTLLRTYQDSAQLRCVTRYLGSYQPEEHATNPGTGYTAVRTLHRHYLPGAVYTEDCPGAIQRGTSASKVHLAVVLTDHIGSTDLIVRAEWNHQIGSWDTAQETAMDAERQSFNSWGERRDAANWSANRTAYADHYQTSAMDVDKGFTGHEMLDDFGIIHMNGRIYDPELGRFLSADPFVQVPEYSQNFNRYSYVLNNPLSYTDSSGHYIDLIAAAAYVVNAIVSAVTTYTAAVATAYASGGIIAAAGAAVGGLLAPGISSLIVGGAANITASAVAWAGAQLAVSAYSIGSSLAAGASGGDVLLGVAVNFVAGAITSYDGGPGGSGGLHGLGEEAQTAWKTAKTVSDVTRATSLTAKHVAGHAVIGGASQAALGGRFQDGFLSAGVSTLMMDAGLNSMFEGKGPGALLGRTTVASVVGGTATAIGGGKFANGAITAAWQHLLNNELEQFAALASLSSPVVGRAVGAAVATSVSDGPFPVGEVVGAVVVAGALTYDLTQRVYVTYELTNAMGDVYVGRTSGYGDPRGIVWLRYIGHHMRLRGFGSPKVDVAAQGIQAKPAIRGREQQLIDFHGGIGHPRVANLIRGVSKYNPLGRAYHNASDLYFGNIAPYTGKW
jgi:RHS repeat-associated protein